MDNSSVNTKENNSVGSILLGLAAIIGGAYVTSFLLDKFSEKKVKYSCPNCSSDIDYKQEQCKVCQTKLNWDF